MTCEWQVSGLKKQSLWIVTIDQRSALPGCALLGYSQGSDNMNWSEIDKG